MQAKKRNIYFELFEKTQKCTKIKHFKMKNKVDFISKTI